MKRDEVNQEMTAENKLAQATVLGLSFGLSSETISTLKEKYGPLSYDIITKAHNTPAKLMQNINQDENTFAGAIKYFATHNISIESLAQALEKDQASVASELSKNNLTPKQHPIISYKEISLEQLTAALQARRLENAVDSTATRTQPQYTEVHKKEEPQQNQSQPTIPPYQEVGNDNSSTPTQPTQTIPVYTEVPASETEAPATPPPSVESMTVNDYAQYCSDKDKPAASYKALEEAAWKDFGIGEGLISDVYIDKNGHATIGNGHLILRADHLNSPKDLADDKQSYMALPLVSLEGKPLTPQQKSAQFDMLARGMRNGTLKTEPIPNAGKRVIGCRENGKIYALGKLNQQGMREVFNQDFKAFYNRVKYDKFNTRTMFPEFDKFPLPVQLEVLHTLYAGQISELYKRTKNCNNDIMAIHNAVVKIRDNKGTSAGERKTIKAAGDSIKVAQNNFIIAQGGQPSKLPTQTASSTVRYTRVQPQIRSR